MNENISKMLNMDDFEAAARDTLPKEIYDFFAGGANDEICLVRNQTAFKEILLTPRVLTGKKAHNTKTKILGMEINQPILFAPTAFQQLLHQEGEIATARAASKLGVINILSTMSSMSLEEIKVESNDSSWYQLYIFKDRTFTTDLVKRAELAGFKALVVTVDAPIMGRRFRDLRNNFQLQFKRSAGNFLSYYAEHTDFISVKKFTDDTFENALTWDDISWLKSISKLPIIVKGIMNSDDALCAIEYGAASIIISNHGGRQLDAMPAPIEVLAEIAEKVSKKITILLDGGIRRGGDIFKGLALGADAVLIGRPILWGLASDGEQGIIDVVSLLHTELCETMTLCGFSTIEDIKLRGKSIIWSRAP